MVDYYRVLGVSREASGEDIKAAFRRLAFKFHPDRHANASKTEQGRASDCFRQVKEAYEILGNEKRRDVYNRTGSSSAYSRQGTSSGSPYSSTYSSAYAARGAYERSSHQWQRASSAGAYKTEWTYNKTSYGGRYGTNTNRQEYQRSMRWNWPPPAEGPRIVFRATLFGMAVVTLMFMDSIINTAWKRNNNQKSYEEMVKIFQEKKLAEERLRRKNEKNPRGDT